MSDMSLNSRPTSGVVGSALRSPSFMIGFGLTLPAIWLTSGLWNALGGWVALLLLPGPVFGLWSLSRGKSEA
mgnify:CR=1 FL=1